MIQDKLDYYRNLFAGGGKKKKDYDLHRVVSKNIRKEDVKGKLQYFIHDNGGRPFCVLVSGKGIEVRGWKDEEKELSQEGGCRKEMNLEENYLSRNFNSFGKKDDREVLMMKDDYLDGDEKVLMSGGGIKKKKNDELMNEKNGKFIYDFIERIQDDVKDKVYSELVKTLDYKKYTIGCVSGSIYLIVKAADKDIKDSHGFKMDTYFIRDSYGILPGSVIGLSHCDKMIPWVKKGGGKDLTLYVPYQELPLFKVVVGPEDIKIYKKLRKDDNVFGKIELPEDDCDPCASCGGSGNDIKDFGKKLFVIEDYVSFWPGFDQDWHDEGNNILVKLGDYEYMLIGASIFKFKTEDVIYDFISPVGPNDVPYPLGFGEKNFYVFWDEMYLKNDDIYKLVKDVDDNDDFTQVYIEYGKKLRSKGKGIKGEVVRERRW